MEPSSSLVTREGPSVVDYLIDFFRYLKNITGFRADHFRAPAELQEILESMELYKMPQELWIAILNAALKLVAELSCIENVDQLIFFIVTVVIELIKYLLKMFFLRSALRLLSIVDSSIISAIITCIYHFVTWAMTPLMDYIKPKIEEYMKFAYNQFSAFYGPKIHNN